MGAKSTAAKFLPVIDGWADSTWHTHASSGLRWNSFTVSCMLGICIDEHELHVIKLMAFTKLKLIYVAEHTSGHTYGGKC